MPKSPAESIAELNDNLRQAGEGGDVLVTQSVSALEEASRNALFAAIQQFDEFTPDNDPYQEHDFGKVEHEGNSYFWKIDYYDKSNPNYGSENPSDPEVTKRVMTIMESSEY